VEGWRGEVAERKKGHKLKVKRVGPSEFLLVVHVPYYEESVILAAPSKVASSNDWW
jgi:hypothetical protein